MTAFRIAFLLIAATLVVLLVGRAAPERFDFVPRVVPDFGVYWGAAAANAGGENPYTQESAERVQTAINPKYPPVRANSGPWTLALLTPLTPWPYEPARLAWFLLEAAILIGCGGMLWQLYGGDPTQADTGWLLAISGYAGLQAITLGQLSPVVLLACVGFVTCERAGRGFVAGLLLSLILVKPQNQLIVLAVGMLWLIDQRRGTVLAGTVVGCVGLSALAAAGNPATFSQYLDAMAHRPPSNWMPPLPATLLRLAFGWDRYWLTFLPLIPGVVWGAWYYWRHRREWAWVDRLPLLLLVSYLASPYGWAYDQLVFLFPLIQLTASTGRTTAALGLNLLMTAYYFTLLNLSVPEFHWVWVAPAATGAYWFATRRMPNDSGRGIHPTGIPHH